MVKSMDVFSEPEFKKAFWVWFDSVLTEDERKQFYNYPMDMAELYFYNKVWKNERSSSILDKECDSTN